MIYAFSHYGKLFLDGTLITLALSALGVMCAMIVASIFALIRMTSKFGNIIINIYVEVIRGTPILCQIYFVYYLPSAIGVNINMFVAGVLALTINSTAYILEIIRSGVNGVPKGQLEAALSLGMPRGLAMREIILPQAFKNAIPAFGNEFITLIKESSIVSVIGTSELMFQWRIVTSHTFLPIPALVDASLIYLVINFTLSKALGRLEKRLKVSG